MKIQEYLKSITPEQQVMVVLQDEEGGRTIIADHFAGFLATSTRKPWLDLEVISTHDRQCDILVVAKAPNEH